MKLAVALVHHPVLDRAGAVVTSAITNVDLHDIARSAYTFGAEAFYVVHPVTAQRELANTIRQHWVDGPGGQRIPDRRPPLEAMRIMASLDEAIKDWGNGDPVELWTTSATRGPRPSLGFRDAALLLKREQRPILLALGTAWGLAVSVHERARFQLEPIQSPRADGYNHLSVRAAAAILLDRLRGGRADPEPGSQ